MTNETGSQAAFARRHGVSKQTATDWKKRGILVFADDGAVDFEASDKALAAQGVRQADLTPEDSDVDAATIEEAFARMVSNGQALLSKADAERVKENFAALLKQLDYDRQSGAVAEIDDVIVAVASEYSLVRNKLLNIGSRVAPRIAVMRVAEEIKAMIDAEIVMALEELTTDVHGETDFDRLRESIQERFRPAP